MAGTKAHLYGVVEILGADNRYQAVVGAQVTVFKADGVTLFNQAMFNAADVQIAAANTGGPLTTDANGVFEAFAVASQTVVLSIAGGAPAVGTIVKQSVFNAFNSGP